MHLVYVGTRPVLGGVFFSLIETPVEHTHNLRLIASRNRIYFYSLPPYMLLDIYKICEIIDAHF